MSSQDGVSLGEHAVIKATDAALLVQDEEGEEMWVPKSVIHDDSEVFKADQQGDLIVKVWWAEKEGLA